MGKGILMKLMATICAFLLCSGIAGAYALWVYPTSDIEEDTQQVGFGMAEFLYKPEEILPDEEEDSEQQRNHMDIIWELLFNSKMGLNSKKDSLANSVEQHGLLHYLENVQGGNLKHLIDVTDGGKNLGFVLEYIDETQFYGYTFYRIDQELGVRITVYRTLFMINNDKSVDENDDGKMDEWIAHSSIQGTAISAELSGYQCTILNTSWVSTMGS